MRYYAVTNHGEVLLPPLQVLITGDGKPTTTLLRNAYEHLQILHDQINDGEINAM